MHRRVRTDLGEGLARVVRERWRGHMELIPDEARRTLHFEPLERLGPIFSSAEAVTRLTCETRVCQLTPSMQRS